MIGKINKVGQTLQVHLDADSFDSLSQGEHDIFTRDQLHASLEKQIDEFERRILFYHHRPRESFSVDELRDILNQLLMRLKQEADQ